MLESSKGEPRSHARMLSKGDVPVAAGKEARIFPQCAPPGRRDDSRRQTGSACRFPFSPCRRFHAAAKTPALVSEKEATPHSPPEQRCRYSACIGCLPTIPIPPPIEEQGGGVLISRFSRTAFRSPGMACPLPDREATRIPCLFFHA